MKKRDRIKNQSNRSLIGILLLAGFVLCIVLATRSVSQAAVEVSATLSPAGFPLDRAAALNITVTGAGSFEPEIPEVDGLSFYQRGQSTQRQFINGNLSSSVTLTFLVQADRIGKYTIPPITVKSKGERLKTQPIHFEVTASRAANISQQSARGGTTSAARLRSGEAEKLAFLRVTFPREKSYLGEVVPVQIQAFFREGIKANLNSLPQLHGEGYVLQQLERDPVQTRGRYNNKIYSVLTWQSVLSGIKEGEHEISFEIDATLFLPEQRRAPGFGGSSLFNDPFFNSFFSSYREKNVKVASPVLKLSVMPLPETDRPKNFSGAIGNFQLSVSADPVELSPGDPISLRMTVSGQGNFDRVKAPVLRSEEGWKTYTPSSELLQDGGPGRGKKIFEQALVAKDPSITEIPPVEFSYFDPSTASYKILASDPVPLTFKGSASVTAPSVSDQKDSPVKNVEKEESDKSAQTVKSPIQGLAPLQYHSGGLDQQITPLFAKRWFQIVALLILVCLVAAIFFKIRAARYARNPQLFRTREMKTLLEKRLQQIDKSLEEKNAAPFLAHCRRAIQEQLGLLWDVPSAAITYADLEKRIPEDSVLRTVFRAADESAYGTHDLSRQEMQKFATALKTELESLG